MPDKDTGSRTGVMPNILMAAFAAGCGAGSILWLGTYEPSMFTTVFDTLRIIVPFVLFMVIAVLIHIVAHEIGHLVAGTMSGYTFVSFRVGRWMVTQDAQDAQDARDDGHPRVSLLSIPGTAGQCLLAPPAPQGGTYPFLLYNLGGVAMNLALAAVFLLITLMAPWSQLFGTFCICIVVSGVYLAATNAIPLQIQGINNDGATLLGLTRNEDARRAFWIMLFVNAQLTGGKRLRDLSGALFDVPPTASRDDALVCNWGGIQVNYHFDRRDFATARLCTNEWLNAPGLPALIRYALLCDYIFMELLGGASKNTIDSGLKGGVAWYLEKMGYLLQIPRLLYAYELIINHDAAAAQAQLRTFNTLAQSYPYPGEVVAERELIALVDHYVQEQEQAADNPASPPASCPPTP